VKLGNRLKKSKRPKQLPPAHNGNLGKSESRIEKKEGSGPNGNVVPERRSKPNQTKNLAKKNGVRIPAALHTSIWKKEGQ